MARPRPGPRTQKRSGQRPQRSARGHPAIGYTYPHTAIDDHSGLADSEILPDGRAGTAAAFWSRARNWFTSCGIQVRAVLTDNGSCYRSCDFTGLLAAHGIRHRRTRPYRPQTKGIVGRFNRTLLTEWAHARPYASESARAAALPRWLHLYNHHRHHTAIGGLPPRPDFLTCVQLALPLPAQRVVPGQPWQRQHAAGARQDRRS